MLYYKTKVINPRWCEYDRVVAKTHLHNYGVIYCDEKYQTPIDNEFELLEIERNEEINNEK